MYLRPGALEEALAQRVIQALPWAKGWGRHVSGLDDDLFLEAVVATGAIGTNEM